MKTLKQRLAARQQAEPIAEGRQQEKWFDFRPVKGSPAIAFVKPHMGSNIDADDKPRSREGYYTAGAFEAPPEMSPPPRPKPPADLSPQPQTLPADRLAELPAKGDLAALTEAMKELDIKPEMECYSQSMYRDVNNLIKKDLTK